MQTTTFLEIAARHHGDLRAYSHQLSRDYDLAEDALQDSILASADAWPADRQLSDDAVRKYLGRAIKNKLRPSRQKKEPLMVAGGRLLWSRLQLAAPMQPISSIDSRYQAEIQRDDANHDLIRQVLLSLEGLPKFQAEAYRLSLAGFTTRQIAEKLNTTQSRAQRAAAAARHAVQARFSNQYAALQQTDNEEDEFDFAI